MSKLGGFDELIQGWAIDGMAGHNVIFANEAIVGF